MSSSYLGISHILGDLDLKTFVVQYEVLKYEHTVSKFQLRLRIEFTDQTVLYTNEYLGADTRKYAFQWQTAGNTWLVHWDNAPHFPELATFPHHKHDYRSGSEVVTESTDISLNDVLIYIYRQLKNTL
jgi:hypothetical protein